MHDHPEKPIFGPEDATRDPDYSPTIRPWRSLAKAISWRVIGTIDTLLLSWSVITYLGPILGRAAESGSDNLKTAGYIALTEIGTKLVLYFFHERAWARARWGVEFEDGMRRETHGRTATKTATWRTIASIDTFLLALFFTGNVGTALSIGGIEIFTKLLLYFVHERIWVRIPFGLEHQIEPPTAL
jgi:uncharacterized membrane protein